MAACLCTSLMFSGCEKEDDGKDDGENGNGNGNGNNVIENVDKFIVNAKVENGDAYNSQIDSVKFSLKAETRIEIAKGKYSNGGFTLEFPQTVNANLLATVGDELEYCGVYNSTISDPEAKITTLTAKDWHLNAYKSGVRVGDIYFDDYGDFDYGATAFFVYATKDVIVSGSSSYNVKDIINISLKKGWNIVYMIYANGNKGGVTLTTQEPAGFKWPYSQLRSE